MRRLTPGEFPEVRDWQGWVIADAGADLTLPPVFLWRLAAFCKYELKRPIHLISAFRTCLQQKVLYDAWIRYKKWLDGGKVGPAPPVAAQANPPGLSWHEFWSAVDTHGPGTNYPELVKASKLIPSLQVLAKYGLSVTNYLGNPQKSQVEWWHIMCVEAMKWTGAKRDFLLPDDWSAEVDEMLKLNDNTPTVRVWQDSLDAIGLWPATVPKNTNFGPTTLRITNDFLSKSGLPQSGVVDEAAWAAMAMALAVETAEASRTAQDALASAKVAKDAQAKAEATAANLAVQNSTLAATNAKALASLQVIKTENLALESINTKLEAGAAATRTHLKALADLAVT